MRMYMGPFMFLSVTKYPPLLLGVDENSYPNMMSFI
jgi:hypothetical protein